MATLAQLLVQQAGRPIESKMDIAGNVAKGAQLALNAEQLQIQKQQLEQSKAKLLDGKDAKFVPELKKISEIKGLKPAQKARIARAKRDALGLTDLYPDDVLEFAINDDLAASRIAQAQADYQAGRLDRSQYNGVVSDVMSIAGYSPLIDEAYKEGSRIATLKETERGKDRRAAMQAEIQGNQALDQRALQINQRTQKLLEPIQENRESLLDARYSIKKAIQQIKDGKPVNEIELQQVAFKMAKAAQGAGVLTDRDISRLTGLPGLKNITEDNIRKYITGGENLDRLVKLYEITEDSAAKLENTMQQRAKTLEPLFNSARNPGEAEYLRKQSGINQYIKSNEEIIKERFAPPTKEPPGGDPLQQIKTFKAANAQRMPKDPAALNQLAEILSKKTGLPVDQVKKELEAK